MDDQRPDFTREPMDRFGWEKLLRRAVIKPPSIKMLGFVMATYADEDGSNIFPGQKRLANIMGTSVSTVERGQRALETVGFIEMVRKGHSAGRGSSKGYASEYRLTVPSDLLDRVPMLDKDGNHPSPMTGDSTKDPASVTGESEPLPNGLPLALPSRHPRESEETPVNLPYTPVTGAETPVNSAYIPVTHDGPPSHLHNPKNQYMNHQGVSVTLGDAHEKTPDEKSFTQIGENPEWAETYYAASQHLQNRPDHGAAAMSQARALKPDGRIADRVIAAATATGWNTPGMEAAS